MKNIDIVIYEMFFGNRSTIQWSDNGFLCWTSCNLNYIMYTVEIGKLTD